jgi:hypothetical protein
MKDIPRRTVLLSAPAAAAAALLPGTRARSEDSPNKGARQRFSVGPVSLKDFLSPIRPRDRDASPVPLDEVQKVVGAVELFVIDDREWDGRAWRLADPVDGLRPRLAIAGDLAQTVTGPDGKKFAVGVKGLEATGIDTHCSEPNWRKFHIVVTVDLWHQGGLEVTVYSDRSDTELAYDVHGVRLAKAKDGRWKLPEASAEPGAPK